MSASVWTLERTRRLILLWDAGRTAAAIAGLLGPGISRCAVLGKVHRLGLVREPGDPPLGRASAGQGAKRPASPGPRGPDGVPPSLRRRRVVPASTSNLEAPGTPDRPEATVLSVKRGQCRWPYGAPGADDFGFCGRPATRGAFCAAHAAIGYQTRPLSAEGLMRLAGLDQTGILDSAGRRR